jgi:hypothetical protein
MPRVFAAFLALVVMSACTAAALAQAPDHSGTSWSLGGSTRLRVKKFGKFGQPATGRVEFSSDGRFMLVLDGFFTLSGDYDCGGRQCALDPDPDSLESALNSLLQVSVFQFAARGVEPSKVKLKVRLRTKRGTDTVKARLSIQFNALLALKGMNPNDPEAELIKPFRMKFRFNGESQGA